MVVWGNFTGVFFTFPESGTNKCLRTELFLCVLCSLKLCQTAVLGYLGSIVECLWDQLTIMVP